MTDVSERLLDAAEVAELLHVPVSSLEMFVRHARSFGTEGVLESAGGLLCPSDLDLLRIELDRIEAERNPGRFTVGKRRRRSEAETTRYVLALAQELDEQGLCRVALEHAVADKLGVSDAYAARLLKRARSMSETAEIAPRKRLETAGNFATKRESGIGVPRSGFRAEIR